MRLFAALPLPPSAIRRLSGLRLRLATPSDGLRWSSPEQWHITLKFFGDVSPATAACLRRELESSRLSTAEVQLDGLGLFASKGILHVSVASSGSLEELQAQVLHVGSACGIPPEARPFRPHITLARSKGRVGAATLDRLSASDSLKFGAELRWAAEECLLLESTLRPDGAEYTVYARLGLLKE